MFSIDVNGKLIDKTFSSYQEAECYLKEQCVLGKLSIHDDVVGIGMLPLCTIVKVVYDDWTNTIIENDTVTYEQMKAFCDSNKANIVDKNKYVKNFNALEFPLFVRLGMTSVIFYKLKVLQEDSLQKLKYLVEDTSRRVIRKLITDKSYIVGKLTFSSDGNILEKAVVNSISYKKRLAEFPDSSNIIFGKSIKSLPLLVSFKDSTGSVSYVLYKRVSKISDLDSITFDQIKDVVIGSKDSLNFTDVENITLGSDLFTAPIKSDFVEFGSDNIVVTTVFSNGICGNSLFSSASDSIGKDVISFIDSDNYSIEENSKFDDLELNYLIDSEKFVKSGQ